jgi:hypothetical protein
LSFLVNITSWWSSFYGNHQLVSVFIRFLHLGSLVLGAGTGLFSDRQVLGAVRSGGQEREAALTILDRAHAHVVRCLIVVIATGILMMAADTHTYLASIVYWTKMAMVGILLANGVALQKAERRARQVGVSAGWPRLAVFSTISGLLWLITLFLGTLLTVAA